MWYSVYQKQSLIWKSYSDKMLNPQKIVSLVGAILLFVAIMMIFPLVVSLFYQSGDSGAFVISILITTVVGGVMFIQGRKERDINLRSGFAVVTFGWLAMAFAGALPFYLSGAIPSFTDCVFESMSGFSTTGSSILGPHLLIESLPKGVLFWRSLTHWIGGMGIILLSLAILPLLGVGGMQLYRAEFPGPVKDKLTPRIKTTASILWGVYLLISGIEFTLLCIGGMTWFDAACHTFGTMATGGFSTHTESIAFFDSKFIHYVIIVFMFIAGTNFALHFRFLKGKPGFYWKSREFRLYLILICSFAFILFVTNLIHQQFDSTEEAFRQSLFHTVSIMTTTGFGTADWEIWGDFAQVMMVAMMFIGGMAGSTGGGAKVVRVQIILHQIVVELKKLIHPQAILPLRIGHILVDDNIVRNVLSFILAFVLILLVATAVISAFEIDMVTSFGATLACLSNIGPGLGDAGPADHYGHFPIAVKWILVMLMMLGRLEVFTVLVLFSRYFWRK